MTLICIFGEKGLEIISKAIEGSKQGVVGIVFLVKLLTRD